MQTIQNMEAECSICIENVLKMNIFTCLACKYTNCISCHKKYLLTSIQDQHCINCRAIIPYDIFLEKFGEKWIFDKYKKHRYSVLWEREQSLIPQTVHLLGLKKQQKNFLKEKEKLQKEKEELCKQINLKIYLIDNKILELSPLNQLKNGTKLKFNYTYACPIDKCKGFLNEKFECDLCDSLICKKCYTDIGKNLKGNHECIPEMIETFNTIKKEAKPCPTCGEFISKINGCDQMFCVKCGTAFSWKSGLVEKGIIHNPHAHLFFQNNPELLANYQNNNNQNNNQNNCRDPIPNNAKIIELRSFIKDDLLNSYLKNIYRGVAEFRQYRRNTFLNFLNNPTDPNLDLRMKFLNNEIDEKGFKYTIHTRNKKLNFKKQLIQIIISTYDIVEIILWNIYDSREFYDIVLKNKNLLVELNSDTNKNIINLSNKFGYKTIYKIHENYHCPYYSL